MSDQSAIQSADEAFFSALNAMFDGDAAPMEALWAHEGDVAYLGPEAGLFHTDWAGIRADWEKQAAAKMGGAIRLVRQHITLGTDLAVSHHIAEASGQGPGDAVQMRGTNVYRKIGGAWKLVAHHSDPLPYVDI